MKVTNDHFWLCAREHGRAISGSPNNSSQCDKIFREKVSGARADRNQLRRLLQTVAPGDLVIVTRSDRLARSTRDLLNVLGTIAENGTGFRSLSDTWTDTTTAHGRLMLTVLGGLAEFERETHPR
jgi:DNA invertase Pin-like site-specific DNA recombinase